MDSALKLQTTVLPGHRIDVSSPDLPEGSPVELIVLVPTETPRPRRSVLEVLDSLPPGPRLFKDADEVDRYLQLERDSWDR